MTPGDILQRVKRLFSGSNSNSKPGSRRQPTGKKGADARKHRHDVVAALQKDVRELQQQITDLSEREGIDPDDAASMEESSEMASLHRQLSVKQKELSRYQARI